MWLVMDLGNSEFKLILIDDSLDQLHTKPTQLEQTPFYRDSQNNICMYRMPTKSLTTSGLLISSIRRWLDGINVKESKICDVLISSVVPSVNSRITSVLREQFNWKVHLIRASQMRIPFMMQSSSKREIGADILANLMAVYYLYPLPSIVFDYGTATTISVLSESGAIGDIIIPGFGLSLNALHDKLPHLSVPPFQSISFGLGHQTDQCIQLGMYWSGVFITESWVKSIERFVLKQSCASVIATGGFAKQIQLGTSSISKVDTNLIFKGSWMLYRYHCLMTNFMD